MVMSEGAYWGTYVDPLIMDHLDTQNYTTSLRFNHIRTNSIKGGYCGAPSYGFFFDTCRWVLRVVLQDNGG